MEEEPLCGIRRHNISHIIAHIVKMENDTLNGSTYSKLNKTVLDKAKPMWGKILIYVYEDGAIPYDIGLDVEKSMGERYSSKNVTDGFNNFQADLAIIDLFRTFPGRTFHPDEADFFVVPYPHASHCLQLNMMKGWIRECRHISRSTIKKMINGLMYYKGNEKKHVFINSMEVWQSHSHIRNVPLSINYGPRLNEGGYHIVVPYLSDDQSVQPSAVKKRGEQWWLRPRELSLAYFFGLENPKMRQNFRKYRRFFFDEVRQNWTSPYLGKQLPYVVESLDSQQQLPSSYFNAIYKHSVFCPTLPGDGPTQKRFFDVIAMGCIPVVLAFETDMSSQSKTSWHAPGGHPVEYSLPFAKHSTSISTENEIDYDSFVVKIKEVGEMRETLESLFRNHSEIQRLQLNLMKNAQYFLYGIGDDSHLYEDAFAKIVQSLEYYKNEMLLNEATA
ncbi:hypothetical protein ACHAXM_002928 [Skeletonema potamos]